MAGTTNRQQILHICLYTYRIALRRSISSLLTLADTAQASIAKVLYWIYVFPLERPIHSGSKIVLCNLLCLGSIEKYLTRVRPSARCTGRDLCMRMRSASENLSQTASGCPSTLESVPRALISE